MRVINLRSTSASSLVGFDCCSSISNFSLITCIDGMDQAKTNLGDLPVWVVGAIAHGAKKDVFAFLVTHYTKETNTVLEVLRRVLESRDSLPPTLIIQLDNTTQENKNSRMFSFLGMLIEKSLVEEIVINFSPVGHTHEDVDAIFSLIAQEFKKILARSIPELKASIGRAIKGVRVEHLDAVDNVWSSIEHLCSRICGLTTAFAFQLRRNAEGKAVIRYKGSMSETTWLPVGRSAIDVSFAPRMFVDGVVTHLEYVVPCVLPAQSLRTYVQNSSRGLRLQRSVTRYPDEAVGAALSWWNEFLTLEEQRIHQACSSCVAIRIELSAIVIHQCKGENTENNAKAARRAILLDDLAQHDCIDRVNGKLSVGGQVSGILNQILSHVILPRTILPVNSNHSESASASDVQSEHVVTTYLEPADGMAHIRQGAIPAVYIQRNKLVQTGDFAIIKGSSEPGEYMGDHPFWVVRITKMTNKKHWIQYFGDTFLGTYQPLHYIESFPAASITYLHWGFTLAGSSKHGGTLKQADLKVLSLNVDLPWQLPSAERAVREKKLRTVESWLNEATKKVLL